MLKGWEVMNQGLRVFFKLMTNVEMDSLPSQISIINVIDLISLSENDKSHIIKLFQGCG